MPTICRVSGCTKSTSGYSPLCPAHRSRKRRHGHEEQFTVSKTDLKPFVDKVHDRIAKQPEASLWSVCDQRWDMFTDTLRDDQPKTIYSFVRSAMKELVRLKRSVSGRSVAVTTIAMYLLQQYEPRRFRSEEAFRAQLVRRVRSLSDASFSQWEGASDGRSRRAMKELEPRAVAYTANLLVELFGPAGVKITQLERRDEDERNKGQAAYGAALAEVQ